MSTVLEAIAGVAITFGLLQVYWVEFCCYPFLNVLLFSRLLASLSLVLLPLLDAGKPANTKLFDWNSDM